MSFLGQISLNVPSVRHGGSTTAPHAESIAEASATTVSTPRGLPCTPQDPQRNHQTILQCRRVDRLTHDTLTQGKLSTGSVTQSSVAGGLTFAERRRLCLLVHVATTLLHDLSRQGTQPRPIRPI
jgi:hypothetical protein